MSFISIKIVLPFGKSTLFLSVFSLGLGGNPTAGWKVDFDVSGGILSTKCYCY